MAKFLCHATLHTNFLEKKTLKEKKKKKYCDTRFFQKITFS